MTADRLVRVAQIMDVRVDDFFDDTLQGAGRRAPGGLNKVVLCLAGEVMNIPDSDVRKTLYHLIRTISKAMNQNDVMNKHVREE
jgi:hypothetical protein